MKPKQGKVSRRRVLQGVGSALAVSALPMETALAAPVQAGGGAARPSTPSVMPTLSAYMSDAATRALPADAIEHTKHHILDTLAAMVSGTELPPGSVALQFARMYGDRTSTIAGSTLLCGPIEAAFVNAMLAHADETDDSHAPSQSHPGCAVVPAALAVAEQMGTDGNGLMRAVALGYDVGTRLTMALGVSAFQTETHISSHALAALFGAAAASASAAKLSPQQMRWVLDYTAQQASGIKVWQRDTDHIEKAFVFAGVGTKGGVMATELVLAGATGVDDVLSGADNFLDIYGPHANAAKLVERLGERYEVTRTNIKKWTVGSPIQAPLDAIELMLKKRPFEASQVRQVSVRVATSEGGLVDNREMPDICMQHMVAVMLIDKTASFRAAHDKARMNDPSVRKVRAAVQLVMDADLEKRLPRREAIVSVTLVDGTQMTEHVDAVRGTTDNPMPREEVIAKCRDLMAPILGAARCDQLIARVMTLEQATDIRAMRPLLQRSSA